MTRFGDLLHFVKLFKACGNSYFDQIATHIFGNFCKGVKIFLFACEIILGNFYRHLATIYWSRCWGSHQWWFQLNFPLKRSGSSSASKPFERSTIRGGHLRATTSQISDSRKIKVGQIGGNIFVRKYSNIRTFGIGNRFRPSQRRQRDRRHWESIRTTGTTNSEKHFCSNKWMPYPQTTRSIDCLFPHLPVYLYTSFGSPTVHHKKCHHLPTHKHKRHWAEKIDQWPILKTFYARKLWL